jgi:hypothetical protein
MVTAVIEFVQVFHSGKFMDSGPKKLMVALHEGVPRIVLEEMLSSQVMLQAEAFRDRVHVVFAIGDASYVVLAQQADPSWGTGDFADEAPRVENHAYVQAVDAQRVPQGPGWLGTELRVYNKEGVACSTTIDTLKLVLLADDWEFSDEDDARARTILREEPAMLAGRLSACRGVIATPAREREARFYLPQAGDTTLGQAALDAAKVRPQYVQLQAQWEKIWRGLAGASEPDEPAGDWGGEGSVDMFGNAHGERFVLVSFGNDGLESDMPETLSILYRLDAQGALTLMRISTGRVSPTLLLDLNADNVPELLSGNTLHGFGDYGLFVIQEVHSAFNGCTC